MPRGHARVALLNKMQPHKEKSLAQLWENRQRGLPLQTPQEAVVLASIVEKETGQAANAGKWLRCLSIVCESACDCNQIRRLFTVWWAAKVPWRPIRLSEISRPTPYNTYTIFGLPPTPIANPGRAALAAVLDPPSTSALYFVADGTGGHIFADTLAEHNKNVRNLAQIAETATPIIRYNETDLRDTPHGAISCVPILFVAA